MQFFKDFIRWYCKNGTETTLEAMKKMIQPYHNKGSDGLKLGCTPPNLANVFLHSSTTAKFYVFPEKDKSLLEKVRENMVGGPSIVFTQKAVVDKTKLQSSPNIYNPIVNIDACQL